MQVTVVLILPVKMVVMITGKRNRLLATTPPVIYLHYVYWQTIEFWTVFFPYCARNCGKSWGGEEKRLLSFVFGELIVIPYYRGCKIYENQNSSIEHYLSCFGEKNQQGI